jgi:ABC-type branched-subunit amino acid transport system ATPase component/ABC-type branched-subunit amino acid transport system permease subunit
VQRSLAAVVIVGAALATLPLFRLPPFYESFLYLVLHWIVLATSWNILSGYSGYFSFGHGAFFGAGIYTTAVLASRYDVPFLWTLPAAALVAALLGTALGAIVFRVRRLRGELFALVTLAVTFVVGTVVLNTPIDGGPGVYLSAVPVPAIGPSPAASFYLMALATAVLTLVIARWIYGAKLGTGLFAIRDDEDVAEVMGVPTFRYKMIAFAVSCALAGVAGGLHALFVSYVTVGETFSIVVPLTVVLMSVLGGTRHWAGPAVGATLITALLYAATAGNQAVAGKAVFGVVLIVVILFMPEGVLGRLLQRRTHVAPTEADAVPQRRGSLAPAEEAHELGGPSDRVLQARGVKKAFAGVQALSGVDLEVRHAEILALLGPNGSGKSTFINIVSGHFRPDAGVVLFEGREIDRTPAHRIARSGIARTYQIPRPFRHLTVLENVALPAMFGADALDRAAAEHEARRWLAFAGLSAKANALPDELNLHQRKFLELARALASRPRLVMLDEVLSGLTPTEIDEAVRLIRAIREQGSTIVFVEHVMRAVMALADRVVVLNYGQVIAEGQPADVMELPHVVTAFLGKVHA